jgi:hypothetical protein
MAEGWSTAQANSIIDAAVAAYPWMKLHVGAPGSAGTSNAAVETTRKQVTFGAAASGAASNTGAITWSGVAGTEDATHCSFWSASTNGSFGFSGTITANALTAGDDLTFAVGDIDITVPTAS